MDDFQVHAKQLFGVDISPAVWDQLMKYEQILVEWNTRINLTAITSSKEIQVKHFLDSLSVSLAWQGKLAPRKLIDVGTGAGFPGIVLKIVYPDLQLTLVESVGKKAQFLQKVVDILTLQQVTIYTKRAEDLAHEPNHREQYDLAVARAVAPLPQLVEYVLPFVQRGGHMVALKGSNAPAEITAAQSAIDRLGGGDCGLIPVRLPGDGVDRFVIRIPKERPTPRQFPRSTAVIKKSPL